MIIEDAHGNVVVMTNGRLTINCVGQLDLSAPVVTINKLLTCVVGLLRTIMGVIGGLALQIQSAQAAGNSELLAALQCAQQNAQTSAQHVFSALDPVTLLLSLAEPFLGIAGVDPIKIPALAAPDDLAKMQETVNTLDELVKTLKLAADIVGGC